MSAHHDAADVAESLRAALVGHDMPRLASLMDPAVRWGGDEDAESTCHSRADVVRYYEGLHDAGVRAHVDEVVAHEQAIMLGTRVDWPDQDDPDEERPDQFFHVFRLRNGLVYDIRGYTDRQEADEAAAARDSRS